MQTFRNLIPDSALNQETIQLLRLHGGRARAVSVAENVLQLPGLEPEIALMLVSELIKDDWRLRIADGSEHIELICPDDDLRRLDETDFVVFDVETTGPKYPPSRMVEIGACRISGGRIVSEFETLLNPRTPMPSFISRLTGITDSMLKTAPTFEEIAADWLNFAGDAVLVAHAALFDVRFVNHELALVFPGRRMANPHLCTVSLARRLFPELGFYRLHALAEHFDVPLPNHHRAADDARATAQIFLHFLAALREQGIYDLAAARKLNSKPSRRRKHKSLAHSVVADF